MLAVATNLSYYSNNEIIIDSEYNNQFKFEIVKQQNEDVNPNIYPCDTNPIAIKLDNGARKLKLSLTKQEANEFIRLLTQAL